MTSRLNKPDTHADLELHACLKAKPPTSFVMVAGAGSGKTTSLVKALSRVVQDYGAILRRQGRKVACITYTDIAANEIWSDVGNNPLVHVSTIHSFLWAVIRPFQSDISAWVASRVEEKVSDLREAAENFGPRVHQATRDKNQQEIARYEAQRAQIPNVRRYTYGTGSDYARGVLGHDDIIKMVPDLIAERKLLRTIVAQKYPFIFVDESQDTSPTVVQSLKAIQQDMKDTFCLGFFGDPMQKIYPTGVGAISVEPDWATISKPENFRCPTSVLAVANAVRKDGDGLRQIRGRMIELDGELREFKGTARIFVLPADERRSAYLNDVRAWIAERNRDPKWKADSPDADVKVLVIVHRMAAKRLGFSDLYSAFNDKAPEALKSGFLDASAWPLRPFLAFVLPAVEAARGGRDFELMRLLREHCPLLSIDSLRGNDVAQILAKIAEVVEELREMLEPSSTSKILEVLHLLQSRQILELPDRLLTYLKEALNEPAVSGSQDQEDDEEELSREIASMAAYFNCPAAQLWGYRTYINNESPFSTQQGIKGAEYERVLAILDDDEGTHVQFSYNKYFGLTPLSARDMTNVKQGKETAVERTRRLFYVCCSRAMQDLAVVLFAPDVTLAERQVRAYGLFEQDCVHTLADLTSSP